MVHWIWAVSPKKWWFATVHWYHHLLKNCWLFLMISHHIPIIHHYIYIYMYSDTIIVFVKSPNFMMKRPFFTIELLQKNTIHSVADYLRHQTGILQIPKWYKYAKSTTTMGFHGVNPPFLRFNGGSTGSRPLRRPPRRSRSSSSPEPGDRRRGGETISPAPPQCTWHLGRPTVATQWPRFVGNDDVKNDSGETVNSG